MHRITGCSAGGDAWTASGAQNFAPPDSVPKSWSGRPSRSNVKPGDSHLAPVMSRPLMQDEPAVDEDLARVPCAVVRGGTSKAIFVQPEHLPEDPERRDERILSLFGSPHPRQIEGLGGADPLTSKLAMIEPVPSDDRADVLYTFGQVRIDRPLVDYSINCGNISSAVGAYAIEEGFVDPVEPRTRVSIRNTNNDVMITNTVAVKDGRPRARGDFSISGVNRPGARVDVGFPRPGGELTGETFPLGRRTELTARGKTVEATLVDAAGTPSLFFAASDFGLEGSEMPDEMDGMSELHELLDEFRKQAAIASGMASDEVEADEMLVPGPTLVANPITHANYDGGTVSAEGVSLTIRLFLGTTTHKAYGGTSSISLGLASQTPGTVVHEHVARTFEDRHGRTKVVIGHPSGTMNSIVDHDGDEIHEVGYARTARRLMDGVAYVP